MKREFVPANFTLTDDLRTWAKSKFGIDDAEVDRQFELMCDHEFRRKYSCWTRVFRNWIRKADELQQLRRPRKLRVVEELSDEQRQADILKFENDPLIRKALSK